MKHEFLFFYQYLSYIYHKNNYEDLYNNILSKFWLF